MRAKIPRMAQMHDRWFKRMAVIANADQPQPRKTQNVWWYNMTRVGLCDGRSLYHDDPTDYAHALSPCINFSALSMGIQYT